MRSCQGALAVGLASVAAVGLAACSAASSTGSVDPATAIRIVPPLAVRASGCSLIESIGTGFAIGNGRVVTVAHLVRGSTSVTVDDSPARVLALDLRSDVAVVEVDVEVAVEVQHEGTTVRHAVTFSAATVGEHAMALVRRDRDASGLPATVGRTPLIKFEEPMDHTFYERQGMFLDRLTIVKGDSGAPVVNGDGDVIGMIFATSRQSDRAYAVSASEITALLPPPGASAVSTGSC